MSLRDRLLRHRRSLVAGTSLMLFAAALAVLHRELAEVDPGDVRLAVGQVSSARLVLAVIAMTGSYVALCGFDVLALRHLRRKVPLRRVALIAFVANSIGHNVGMSMLSGGALRLRLYSEFGLSAAEIGGLVALLGLTFGLGVGFVAGLATLLHPQQMSELLHLPAALVQAAGTLALAVLVGYLGAALLRRTPVRLGSWQVRLPRASLVTGQLLLAVVDIGCAAATLYWLLPGGTPLSYSLFLGVYVLAVVAGALSHVPAGLGVFEAVLLVGLPDLPREGLLAAILAYRCIYYLLPLASAVLLATAIYGRGALGLHLASLRQAFAWMAPTAVSAAVFVAGAVLLFSGSTPADTGRVSLLHRFMPLPLLEVSHLSGSLAGFGLMILARGLQRRVDAAYHLACWLLAVGVVASLAKGLDYEEALLAGLVLGALWLGRSAFNRRASLMAQSFTPAWTVSVVLVLIATAWLGLFSFRNVDYSDELWWQFALGGDAPRFLRASLLVALTAAGLGLLRLISPAPPESGSPTAEELAHAARIVAGAAHSDAALALVGDKRLLFDATGEAFIMYQVRRQSWVAMGDPVGPRAAGEELAWRFREMVDRHGGRTIFYQVDAENLPLYLDLGLTAMKLGEEAIVPLAGFSLEGSARREVRQAHRRAIRDGLTFEVLEPERVAGIVDAIRSVSDAWLAEKHTREKQFSLGRFDDAYIRRFPCALVRREGRVIAFANLWSAAGRAELSVDLMRHVPDAPKAVMDYLFVELMQWGAAEGYRQFNLGMAPLSGLESHPLAPLWHRLGTLIFQHGENFYNFEGLRAYKDKFAPLWRAKYLATPGGLGLPTVLVDVAALISGGIKGVFAR